MHVVADDEEPKGPEDLGNIPPCPDDIQGAGRSLWDRIRAEGLELTSAELDLLHQACHTRQIVGLLQDEVDNVFKTGELFVLGHAGQPVVNPLMGELRQQKRQFSDLLKALKLPTAEEDDEVYENQASRAGSALVSHRWNKAK